jgi:hypothetical protein
MHVATSHGASLRHGMHQGRTSRSPTLTLSPFPSLVRPVLTLALFSFISQARKFRSSPGRWMATRTCWSWVERLFQFTTSTGACPLRLIFVMRHALVTDPAALESATGASTEPPAVAFEPHPTPPSLLASSVSLRCACCMRLLLGSLLVDT